MTATGFPAPTFTETGTLPTGVTLSTAGLLSGTPTAGGTFPITLTATNGVGTPATQTFTLTVSTTGTAPSITSKATATFTVGTAGSFTVTATGSPTPTFTETGTLPGGVTLSTAGLLSGTPTAGGSFPITITASNGITPNATQAFTLTVDAAPAITSKDSHHLHRGHRRHLHGDRHRLPRPHLHRDRRTAHRGHPARTAGLLSGTPTASGTFPITLTAANGVTPNATQSFTLTVFPTGVPPLINSADATTFMKGTAGTFTVTASGSPAPPSPRPAHCPGESPFRPRGLLSGTGDRQWHLPDHHHRRQRGHPQRHPDLHPHRRCATDHHLG